MSLVQTVLNYHKPSSWDYMAPSTEVAKIELPDYSSEYRTVENKVKQSLGKAEIEYIYRIQNPYLWGRYQLKKEEVVTRYASTTEVELFHATSRRNAESICRINFDWRRASRVKYGAGVSFSPFASYANLECNKSFSLDDRALMLAKVTKGGVYNGSEGLKLPHMGDTTVGNSFQVYVKYYDNEFYPLYLVHYESPEIHFGKRRSYKPISHGRHYSLY